MNYILCGAAHARFAKNRAVGDTLGVENPSKKIGGKKNRDACHGLFRSPWQSVARSGMTSVLDTSWETLGTHGFVKLATRGEFYHIFYR